MSAEEQRLVAQIHKHSGEVDRLSVSLHMARHRLCEAINEYQIKMNEAINESDNVVTDIANEEYRRAQAKRERADRPKASVTSGKKPKQ